MYDSYSFVLCLPIASDRYVPVYVDSKDCMTATAMLIHIVGSDCPVLQALLQHSQQVVQLGTFDTGDRHFRQNIATSPE